MKNTPKKRPYAVLLCDGELEEIFNTRADMACHAAAYDRRWARVEYGRDLDTLVAHVVMQPHNGKTVRVYVGEVTTEDDDALVWEKWLELTSVDRLWSHDHRVAYGPDDVTCGLEGKYLKAAQAINARIGW